MSIWLFVLSVITIFLGFLLYYLYKWYSGYTLLNDPVSLQSQNVIPISDSYYPANSSSSINVWIYINAITTNNGIDIVYYIKDSSNNVMNALYFKRGTTQLLFTPIATGSTYDAIFASDPSYVVMSSFPIQKWTNVFININNMKEFDMFVNGKLVQTYLHDSPLQIQSGSHYGMYLGPTSNNIYAASLQRWPQRTDAGTIRNKYLNGLGSLIPNYNIGYTYSQGGQVIQQNTLF